MAELIVRVSAQDAPLISHVLSRRPESRPHRVVVDAHTALACPQIAAAATVAGLPVLVDPQTFYLQDWQHPGDAWARLPFAQAAVQTPADLLRPGVADAITRDIVDYQLDCGATMLIPPYVHIERAGDGWADVQAALWRATRRHVEASGVALPLVAVLALGWRLLPRSSWPAAFAPLEAELTRLGAHEVALAASKIDTGAKPEDRLGSMISLTRRLTHTVPVIAWNQGTLGEAAVAAGAIGYETGIGWREHCNIPALMASRRNPRSPGGSPRPVYIPALHQSIPKRSVAAILHDARVAPLIVCMEPSCCPRGRTELLADQRAHAITARRRNLEAVAAPERQAWRWQALADTARAGLDVAVRINALHQRDHNIAHFDESALRATLTVANHLRQATGRRHAA
jgi:hypothetical protein